MTEAHGVWYSALRVTDPRGPFRKKRQTRELAEYRHLLALQMITTRETLAERIAFNKRQSRINYLYRRLY